jgi:diacylglycerol kinase (ATP)
MQSLLVINPSSGDNRGAEAGEMLHERLSRGGGELQRVLTERPGDATRAGERAAREGFDRLYVAGGDGTLNEALNGVGSVPGGLSRVTFGVVPLGTGNDFAAALGLDADLDSVLEVLALGATTAVDVGVMNERLFVNASAGGFVAEVSDAVDSTLKTVAGKLAYLVGGAQVLLEHEPIGVRLRGPGVEGREHLLELFAVSNAPLIGGGKRVAPHALIDDGQLDVCLVESMTTLELVGLLAQAREGTHLSDPRVSYFCAERLSFEFAAPIKVNTDGEVQTVTRAEYRLLPGAARFIVPPLERE